jgi:6-phosphogluconolactonase (cycloisomerase 2 family)
LTAIAQTALSDGARALSVGADPMGRFVFVSRASGRGGIDVFAVNRSSGALARNAGATFDLDHQTDALVVDPGGRFLWAIRTFNAAIDTFAVEATSGALSTSSSGTLTLSVAPTAPAVRPDGRVLYFGVADRPLLVAASSDTASGRLTMGAATQVPDIVRSLTVDPSGSYLYVTTTTPFSSDTLFAYGITRGTAGLTRLAESVFATGFDPAAANLRPDLVTFDPLGRFAYLLDRAGRTGAHSRGVFVLPMLSSGLLGPGTLGPFSTPPAWPLLIGDPVAFILDPSGRFAYLADATTNTISAFVVDQTTGGLTASGPPVSVPAGATQMAITP